MEIVDTIKAADLPDSQYVVIGSSSLVAAGILPTNNDIDLAVTPELFADLRGRGWELVEEPHKQALKYGEFDVGIDFGPWTLEELLEDAFYVDGVAFMSLQKLLAWKKSVNRPRDAEHIRLIEDYLARQAASGHGGV